MRKRKLWSVLLALCMALTLLPFGAFAVEKPQNAALMPLNGSATAADGWYRFVPDSDAIYCITPKAEHYVLTIYQSRLALSEIPAAEKQVAESRQQLADGKHQVAEAQAMYDDGKKTLDANREAYDNSVQMVNERREEYERYMALPQGSPERTPDVETFIVLFWDAEEMVKQYEAALLQLEDAKRQLDEAYETLAQAEQDIADAQAMIDASKAGKSGPMIYGADFTDQPILGKFNRGSEFYIHIENADNTTLSCEKLREAFVDVPEDQYYFSPVYWAALNEITNGTDATHFSPDAACTRGQIVTFLWRAAGCPKASGRNPFRDVAAGQYYYDAVLWAVSFGITNGVDATHFAPDDPCTRGQIVTFLWRLLDLNPYSGASPFADVSKGDYYFDAVMWAAEKQITNGMDATHFAPDQTCTRGQVVTFLFRAEEGMRNDAAPQGMVLSFGG